MGFDDAWFRRTATRFHANAARADQEVGDWILRPHAMRVTTTYNGAFALANSSAPHPLRY